MTQQMTSPAIIKIKRIYEPLSDDDGYRILVDRLWPRGMSKQEANIDLWAKEIAPSNELRKWFGHEPEKFERFAESYRVELNNNRAALQQFDSIEGQVITLLYAAKDTRFNHAVVLRDYLLDQQS